MQVSTGPRLRPRGLRMIAPTVELGTGFLALLLFEFLLCGWIVGYMSCMAVRARLKRILDEALPPTPRVEVLPIPIRGDD